VVATAVPLSSTDSVPLAFTVVKLAVPPEDTTWVANVPTVVLTVVPSTDKVSPEVVTRPLDVVPDATVVMPGRSLESPKVGVGGRAVAAAHSTTPGVRVGAVIAWSAVISLARSNWHGVPAGRG
jgi:hypothetical protein